MRDIEELKTKYENLDKRVKELQGKFVKTLSENISLYKRINELERENKKLQQVVEQYKESKILKFNK